MEQICHSLEIVPYPNSINLDYHVFGTSIVQIMPIFANILQSRDRGYGLLKSATGFGSGSGNLFISYFEQSCPLGLMMFSCAMLAPFAMVSLSLVTRTSGNLAGGGYFGLPTYLLF